MGEWPLAFRIITVAANPEVSHYQDRHGAIILHRQVMDWLDAIVPEVDLLVTPPARMFLVEEIGVKHANATDARALKDDWMIEGKLTTVRRGQPTDDRIGPC